MRNPCTILGCMQNKTWIGHSGDSSNCFCFKVIRSVCVSCFLGLQVSTKTVAQCVEFYYTYKKQVKIGRSGTLVYGDLDSSEVWAAEVGLDVRVHGGGGSPKQDGRLWVTTVGWSISSGLSQSSQQLELMKEEQAKNWEESYDRKQACSPARVTQLLQVSEGVSTAGGTKVDR